MVKKIAKYGGKWDFLGQRAILLTSYKIRDICNHSCGKTHKHIRSAGNPQKNALGIGTEKIN
jgi:hypothetical protein